MQLLEGAEYLYELTLDRADVALVDVWPRELFDPDDATNRRGRLRPRLHTGALEVSVLEAGVSVAHADLEVRSSKLDYLDDYRWMLNGLASEAAEILMQRFGPTKLNAFNPDEEQDTRTLYQRFAFLQSVLRTEEFGAAIQQVIARPHHLYETELENRRPQMGVPASSSIVRQIAKRGPRSGQVFVTDTAIPLPEQLVIDRHRPTTDTDANRFVRFALEHWRRTADAVRRALGDSGEDSAPVRRGLLEVGALIDDLDALLGEELFRSVSQMAQFPAANQVIQKREGYREIARAFVNGEAAAAVVWEGSEDVFAAGQRDVAALYEFWVYLQLRRILASFCDDGLDELPLFVLDRDRLVLDLRRGRSRVLRGRSSRLGRTLELELWFNRSFERQSWTRTMKPDCSLRVSIEPGYPGFRPDVWLHFDAKYRVEQLDQLFAGYDDDDGPDQVTPRGTARRDDLLKMHAYRDAIHRSVGAFVLYPGSDDDSVRFRRYREILPGVGAFALRPASDGDAEAEGRLALSLFLQDVLSHLALQTTARERVRYWTDRAYEETQPTDASAVEFLRRPPADTQVLLGYVRDSHHLDWIVRNRLYNLRADDRTGSIAKDPSALSAELLLLYGDSDALPLLWSLGGEPLLLNAGAMVDRGYPSPTGELYCCLQLEALISVSLTITAEGVVAVRERRAPAAGRGAPVVVRWSDLAA